MAIGAGMSCVKYLLFCFNLLFAITGVIILIAGVHAQINASPYMDLTDESFYQSGPVALIIVGVIVFIVAFFGCCGAVKENHCMIITFSILLLIIFVAELAVGIAGYVRHQDLEDTVSKGLNNAIVSYNNNTDVQNMFDVMQTDLQCCGVQSPDDWAAHGMKIPNSCCAINEISDGKIMDCTPTSPNFHNKGCINELVSFLKNIALVLGGVGIGIAFIQLLGVIFACCLARSIRHQYETV